MAFRVVMPFQRSVLWVEHSWTSFRAGMQLGNLWGRHAVGQVLLRVAKVLSVQLGKFCWVGRSKDVCVQKCWPLSHLERTRGISRMPDEDRGQLRIPC